jgi:hypothetical protein
LAHHDEQASENGDPEHGKIPPSYYHASAATPPANHSDFFNTHAWLQQLSVNSKR